MLVSDNDGKALVITRIFDAPRELVWKTWTKPDIFKKWWGPKDFTTPVSRMDFRVGGETFSCMRALDGQDFCSKGVYLEIIELERLIMTDSFADEEGNLVSPTHYGFSSDFPTEMQIEVIFEGEDGKTRLTLKHSDISKLIEEELEDMRQGWDESLDKLAEYLEKFLTNFE
jgi:uncharacterized protein YndB with AHSA1/START domain